MITQQLPKLEKELEKAWDKVPHFNVDDFTDRKIDYDKVYGGIDKLDKQIYDLKTEIMLWAIKNRNKMWT